MKVSVSSAEMLLQVLQRISKSSKQVEQVHSLLTTCGYLFMADHWINTLLFNTLMRTYLCLSRPWTSMLVFTDMLNHQAPPNSHTFPSVLKASAILTKSHDMSRIGCSLNAQCVKRGVLNDLYVQTTFIALYSQIGDMCSVNKMFGEISNPCIVSYNAMLDALGKNGDMDLAVSLFLMMPKRDVYSWTSVICGYVSNRYFGEAIGLFSEMMADEDVKSGLIRPNEATFVSVLSSCAKGDESLALYHGKQIHGYMVRHETDLTAVIRTALIAFYGKMGCLSYAAKIFETLDMKKVCTWNAMISSLASNGSEVQALQVFERMKSLSVRPNDITFVAVLSACARAKMVDVGLGLFHSMLHDFGIIPKMEHYGCLVDLLSRAGLVKEAYDCVRGMPFEANASVLGSLLGSCKAHGIVDLGNQVGRQLFPMQPDHCGKYVLLSSIYAGAEMWDLAASFRKAMTHAGIKKLPAFSMKN